MHGVLSVAPGLLSEPGLVLGLSGLLALWDSIWPYLLMLAGFSLIVFVHELGHFAVAKWAGVKVERFAVGFGRELFGFTRGETRYSFNVLPLGGYVKMLGQEDFDDKANELRYNDDPRSFVNKPVRHRMAIVSAGVVMNIIFACFLFMIVFMIGMQAIGPQIALIEPDSPAEKAGLVPGDIIKKINNERVLEFNEITAAILLAEPHEPLEFIVERDGQIMPPLRIVPEYRDPESARDIKRQVVGISPAVTREILAVGPELDASRPDLPKAGDWLVEVDGVRVTDQNATDVFNTLAYAKGDIVVERKDPKDPNAPPQRVSIQIPPRLSLYPEISSDPRTANLLGLAPLAKVLAVEPDSPAYYGGLQPGDVILMWDDIAYPTIPEVLLSVAYNAEHDIPYRVRRQSGHVVEGFVRPEVQARGGATIQALWVSAAGGADGPRNIVKFALVKKGGLAAKAGIEQGDTIVSINGLKYPNSKEVSEAIRGGTGRQVGIEVAKADGRIMRTVVVPKPPGNAQAELSLVADDLLIVADVVPEVQGKPSPAAMSGVAKGTRIKSVNGQPVASWRELIQSFRKHAGTTVEMAVVPAGTRTEQLVQFAVPHSLQTRLGIGPEGRIISIDGRETVTITKDGQPQTLSVRYREGMRTILTELVGKTQVPVEYRENPLGEKRIAHVDVTAEMVDPWVARVNLTPSVLPGPQTVLLRGENALDAVWIGIHKTYYFVMQIYTFLERMIFTRSLGLESMSGPLGIFDLGGQVARADLVKFLFFLAMISANLAVINFLPLPIFDGGLMVFLIIEKIKGSPVSLRVQVATQMIGLFLIIGTFLFVTYQDALRLLG